MKKIAVELFGRYPKGVGLSLLNPSYVGDFKQLACGERSRTVQSLTRACQPTISKGLLLLLPILFSVFISCAQKKRPVKGETEFQKEINADYKDASKSPLKEKDRKSFETLDFFKFDSTYVLTANFKRTPNEKPFKMKTTTDRRPIYVKYGEISFDLKGGAFKLNVYQNQESIEDEEYEDYLFLPFLDETNGLESYGGGRYVDVRIPVGDTMEIDFNKAYNPYCAYNDKYSCPIVPRKNYLKTRVEAGVKAFDKH